MNVCASKHTQVVRDDVVRKRKHERLCRYSWCLQWLEAWFPANRTMRSRCFALLHYKRACYYNGQLMRLITASDSANSVCD